MDTTPLGLFATKARASNRLLYGDLRRLQRNVLPAGATSREEVEVLLSLDRIERVDRDWPGYLAKTVSEFVLSTSDPPGSVDPETATWLAMALADTRPKTSTAVVRTLMGEARVDEALRAFVRRGAKRPAMAEAWRKKIGPAVGSDEPEFQKEGETTDPGCPHGSAMTTLAPELVNHGLIS